MIKVYYTAEEMESLKGPWTELYSECENVTPYQSYGYNIAALPLLSGNLHIITWIRKNIMMAIFPFYVDSSKTLRFINDRHTDFCGPLVRKEAYGDFHMCEELAEHIKETKEIKKAKLENMRYDLFQTSLQFQLKGSFLFSYSRYSFFNVPKVGVAKSAIDSLAQLDKKEKYRLKNIASKMDKALAEWKNYDSAAGEAWPEELIATLTDSMVKAGIRKQKYFSPAYLEFVKNVYDSGLLMISSTYLEGQPVSCNLYLKNGKEMIDWMAFYVQPSYNAWNLLQFLSWFHENGGGILNFARGIYMYKMHNYRPALGSLDRLRYSKSFFGRIGDTFDCLICEIKRMARSR